MISSVTGPDNSETERIITLTISGDTTGESEGLIEYGIILQIPESWEVLAGIAQDHDHKLSEKPAYESFYSPAPGYKVWAGTVESDQGGSQSISYIVKLRVGDFSGTVGELRDYTLKAMSGAFRQGAWETDDPQGIYDFGMVSEERYMKTITVTKVIHDEPVFIPDTDLEAAIRDALGIDPSTVITQEMAESLTDLSASGRSVVSLSGLEYFINLDSLSLDGNMISDLTPLNGLTNLTYLNLTNNFIVDLMPLNALTYLEHLECSSNQLTSLNVNGATNLQHLDCSYNHLASLDVSANTSLTGLSCFANQLTDIPDVTSCPNLDYYNCSYNYFGADDCTTIAAIKAMGLSEFTYNPQYGGRTLDCGNAVSGLIDFNGNGTHDIALFYPDNQKWYIKDQSIPTYGTSDCLPIPGDYNGDGTTDLAVVDLTRPDGLAKWYLDGIGVFIYGLQEWIPVPGDYDGDGTADAALFDPDTGKWYVRGQFVTTYGAGGIPVPGDYNGDGITDIAVFNPDTNKWYIKNVGIFTYGMADCIPVPADYDGDGITDLAVIDTSRPDGMAKWYIRNQSVFIYGSVTDTIPVPGDYDGDGDADPCLFYQNFGKWYARNVGVWTYGNGDMIPLAGNLATRYAISQVDGGSIVW